MAEQLVEISIRLAYAGTGPRKHAIHGTAAKLWSPHEYGLALYGPAGKLHAQLDGLSYAAVVAVAYCYAWVGCFQYEPLDAAVVEQHEHVCRHEPAAAIPSAALAEQQLKLRLYVINLALLF
jgi:hypothetical protein